MKNHLLLITLLLLITPTSILNAKNNSLSIEVQFNPFSSDANSWILGGAKIRYFLNPKNAFRINIGINKNDYENTIEIKESPIGINHSHCKSKGTTFDFSLGYERHFPINKWISLYLGSEIGIQKYHAETVVTQKNKDIIVTNTLKNIYLIHEQVKTTDEGKVILQDIPKDDRSYMALQAGLLGGIDIYLYKGLYLGTEINFNIQHYNTKPVTLDFNISGTNPITEKPISGSQTLTDEKIFHHTELNIQVRPQIRIGWKF